MMMDVETRRYWRNCARTAMGAIIGNPVLIDTIGRQAGRDSARGVAELAYRQANAMLEWEQEQAKHTDITLN